MVKVNNASQNTVSRSPLPSTRNIPSLWEISYTLPPKIVTDVHNAVDPVWIKQSKIFHTDELKKNSKDTVYQLETHPVPVHPLALYWKPEVLIFKLKDKPVVKKLCIYNCCPRIIYLKLRDLCGETARRGAGWMCYPRTDFLLAPGVHAEVLVKATPRANSSVANSVLGLQLAAGHMRDCVVGYFCVEIRAEFLNKK